MRVSEFWIAVSEEFGSGYGRVLAHDLVLGEIGGLTAEQGIAAGADIREVWLALCKATDVPPSRWHGVGQRQPRR
ncbi:MAG: DUF3046 domain-containing protein [Rhodoglobus sp.]